MRSNTDQKKALIKGLQDGTIDAICSHHEPLSSSAKQAPLPNAKQGLVTLILFCHWGVKLVADGVLSTEQLVEKICLNPAKIAGITDYERIGGAVLIDPNQAWTVTKDTMLSAGKNTPFFWGRR